MKPAERRASLQIFVKIKRMITKKRQVMRRKTSKKTQSYMVHHYWWLTRINKLMNIWKEFNVFYKVYNTQMVAVALGPWASHSEDRAEP